jgi:hypothetical protein
MSLFYYKGRHVSDLKQTETRQKIECLLFILHGARYVPPGQGFRLTVIPPISLSKQVE